MSEAHKSDKLLFSLGLCARAGKLIFGTDMVCDALRKSAKEVKIVIEASDTSDNTHKKISDKCAYYGARLERIRQDSLTLGYALGKRRQTAVVAVTDTSLASLVLSNLEAAKNIDQ